MINAIKYNLFQFFKFSLVGISNTLIHYFVFLILLKILHINYLISSGLGFCCGLINSYYLNRRFTFKVTNKGNFNEGYKFIVVNIFALLMNLGCMNILVGLGIVPEIAQILAIIGSYSVNFSGNKFWTFRTR